jgi:hypothetical protein
LEEESQQVRVPDSSGLGNSHRVVHNLRLVAAHNILVAADYKRIQ